MRSGRYISPGHLNRRFLTIYVVILEDNNVYTNNNMVKRKNVSESSNSNSQRIKPIVLANGQLRCPNGTRRKGKYCVETTKKPKAEPVPVAAPTQAPPAPLGASPGAPLGASPGASPGASLERDLLKTDNKLRKIKADAPYISPDAVAAPAPVAEPEPAPVKRIIKIPKVAPLPVAPAPTEPKVAIPEGIRIVKPHVLGNGNLRCPDGTRRTKDGHWCVSKEHYNIPYLREIIDEVARKTQQEAKLSSSSTKTTPHAIILDSVQKTPVALDTRPQDMVEDVEHEPHISHVSIIKEPSLDPEPVSALLSRAEGRDLPKAAHPDGRDLPKATPPSVGDLSKIEPIATTEQQPEEIPLVESLLSAPAPQPSSSSSSSSLSSIIKGETSTEPVANDAKQLRHLNILQREKERAENANPIDSPFLLPTLNDPQFAARIATHKAFADTPYDGTTYDIEKRANEMCQVEFGLMPHQSFVRNFMSAETPYNTLLLFHSLGSGKTCSAISVCEEMRTYMKQSGLREKIIVIASPNVQGNFRKQLFDESRLEKVMLNSDPEEYTWNIQSCVGNSLLREINPGLIKNYPKEKIVSNIQSLINTYYTFMGYGQFANYVLELSGTSAQYEIANIRRHFNNRLLVIDEVQNIRMTEENTNKEATAAAAVLLKVVKHADNLRMLLLTATPMYNSYKEIVWLTNLMNTNDRRSTIEVKDIFDADGNIKTNKSGENAESGLELLRRKLTGYVSYVRGENPYAFPFRIYPAAFAPERALSSLAAYPTEQMNGKPIDTPMTKMPVYINRLSRTSIQYSVYSSIINDLATGKDVYTATGKLKNQLAFDDMDAFGYTVLQKPIEALNIAYPGTNTDGSNGLVGSAGLQSVITYDRSTKTNFEYLSTAPGRIFSPELIRDYSVKIAEIGERVRESEGIVIIYSQYIEGGIVPLALAMEEMGIARYASTPTTRSLFKPSNAPQVEPLLTAAGKPAKYIMITGDRLYSPSNNTDMKVVSSGENKDGDIIKVVLISRAGAEGLDFANVRQLHIMEPWYNMSRMEQIIGRAVRNLSHCRLPFNKRNVQVFLHGTIVMGDITPVSSSSAEPSLTETNDTKSESLNKREGSSKGTVGSLESEVETADMYVYRLVEKKMHLIQNVERVMKESAVDCLIHIGQNNYTKSALSKEPKNVDIPIVLSNGKTIKFTPGDEDDTVYECKSTSGETLSVPTVSDDGKTTYSDAMARTNIQYIGDRIRQLFRESSSWSRAQLEKAVSIKKKVPIEQLFYTLSQFVGNKHNYVIDRYGRFGYIVNNDKYYVFQPMELTDAGISMYERVVPVEYKRKSVSLAVSPEFGKQAPANTQTQTQDQGNEQTEQIVESNALQTLEDLFIAATDKNEMKKSKDWYIHAGHVFEHLEKVHFIPLEAQYNYFAHHFLDLMEEKQTLVKTLFPARLPIDKPALLVRANKSLRVSSDTTMTERALTYFAKRMLFNEKRADVLCVVANKNELVVMKRGIEAGSQWKLVDRTEIEFFAAEMEARLVINKQKLFPVIGFSGDFKGKEMVVKVKDLTQKRNNVGAKIESAGKIDVIKYANQLLGHEQYTQENTDTAKGGITQLGMCAILEFLMRDFTEQKKGGRVYYLGPEQAIELDVVHI